MDSHESAQRATAQQPEPQPAVLGAADVDEAFERWLMMAISSQVRVCFWEIDAKVQPGSLRVYIQACPRALRPTRIRILVAALQEVRRACGGAEDPGGHWAGLEVRASRRRDRPAGAERAKRMAYAPQPSRLCADDVDIGCAARLPPLPKSPVVF